MAVPTLSPSNNSGTSGGSGSRRSHPRLLAHQQQRSCRRCIVAVFVVAAVWIHLTVFRDTRSSTETNNAIIGTTADTIPTTFIRTSTTLIDPTATSAAATSQLDEDAHHLRHASSADMHQDSLSRWWTPNRWTAWDSGGSDHDDAQVHENQRDKTDYDSQRAHDNPLLRHDATMISSTSFAAWSRINPLGIPPGEAPNLPSIRVQDAALDSKRKFYGGQGDKAHLGGFTEMDVMGLSPTVWKHLIQQWNVHSVLDVGCGRGISTSWFYTHGLDVRCVEGSHDAVQQSMMPASHVVEHDFSRGPWWPEKTYDAVWAVEFLEHVPLHYQFNYITAFRKAAILLVTSSKWGGWHHVEVHPEEWWIRKYELYGFRYDEKLTMQLKALANRESNSGDIAPNGEEYNAQHLYLSLKVFINPVVASLPEHAHLFFEHGCYKDRTTQGVIINRPCEAAKMETVVPPNWTPLPLTDAQDQAWIDLVQRHVTQKAPPATTITTEATNATATTEFAKPDDLNPTTSSRRLQGLILAQHATVKITKSTTTTNRNATAVSTNMARSKLAAPTTKTTTTINRADPKQDKA